MTSGTAAAVPEGLRVLLRRALSGDPDSLSVIKDALAALESEGDERIQLETPAQGKGCPWVPDKLVFYLEVPGQPLGKERRVRTSHGVTFSPKQTMNWEAHCATLVWEAFGAKGREPLAEALFLRVRGVMRRPKTKQGKKYRDGRMPCETKPDGDNIQKICGDALKKGGAYVDDKHVVEWRAQCLYAAKKEPARVEIELWSIRMIDE